MINKDNIGYYITIFLVLTVIVANIISILLNHLKKLMDNAQEKSNKQTEEHADGFKIRWTSFKDMYAKKYNTKSEPLESDIIKMLSEMGAKVIKYDEIYIVIPWKYITKWEYITMPGDSFQQHIVAHIVNEGMGIIVPLSLMCSLDPISLAFEKYASEKQDRHRPVEKIVREAHTQKTLRQLLIYVIIGLIALSIKRLLPF